MKLYTGGYLAFYMPQHKKEVEIIIDTPKQLNELLEELHIPQAEVQLVAINGEQATLESTVLDTDEVRIYSGTDGG